MSADRSNTNSLDLQVKQTLMQLAKCLAIIFGFEEEDPTEEQYFMILRNSQFLLTHIQQSDASTILSVENNTELRSLVSLLATRAEVKLPGIRSIYQWIFDFEKASHYYNSKL